MDLTAHFEVQLEALSCNDIVILVVVWLMVSAFLLLLVWLRDYRIKESLDVALSKVVLCQTMGEELGVFDQLVSINVHFVNNCFDLQITYIFDSFKVILRVNGLNIHL